VNGKMTAAVLYGKEDVKIEKVPSRGSGMGKSWSKFRSRSLAEPTSRFISVATMRA
jgi:hypothetical protein